MKMSEVNYEDLSPMMKQYYEIKKNYEGILLFYRLGDFYEMFFDDALIGSRELGLTLTGKNAGLSERIPMCGAPHHSIKTYIQDAIKKGFKVAICEQIEDSKEAKGMVKREVTEVISKGTLTDLDFLDNKDFNYLGSVLEYPSGFVITYADISTGELNTMSIDKDENRLLNVIINNGFKEVLVDNTVDKKIIKILKDIYNVDVTQFEELYEEALPVDTENLDLKSIRGIRHILYYLSVKELKNIDHFKNVTVLDDGEYLSMDVHSIRNLELFETLRLKEKQNSLLWLIDKCKTAMGSRRLKAWMLKPLRDKSRIEARYDKIEKLRDNFLIRSRLADNLYEVYDIERLCGKVSAGNANARDLVQLASSLKVVPNIKDEIKELGFDYEIEDFEDLYSLIAKAINEDAPVTLKDGSLIKEGYDSQLDELKKIRKGGKDFISSIEEEARTLTGINNLKVGYNKVFGYFIEVTNSNKDKVKDEFGWIRKQTLVNAERYISPELKEKENMILSAEEKIIELEYELFIEVRKQVKARVEGLMKLANRLSEIDALVSLSLVSEELRFVRPNLNEEGTVNVISGRHPIVEYVSNKEYVPNDIYMGKNTTTILITGPNMSGKSTYMRELAIIVVLAQMGSFVPAEQACLPIFDKIFTRIGASDDLVSGDSTFMVEMKEANNAIQNATSNSLILFDELGRGTATYDGMSLAKAILEYVDKKIGCKTLFSTHYHELTELAEETSTIKNVHVSAKEENGQVYFLHKVEEGPVDKSYGIHVAKLSGLPSELIMRAEEILAGYEKSDAGQRKTSSKISNQISFSFEEKPKSEVENQIEKVDLDEMRPKDALDLLYDLKKMIKKDNET